MPQLALLFPRSTAGSSQPCPADSPLLPAVSVDDLRGRPAAHRAKTPGRPADRDDGEHAYAARDAELRCRIREPPLTTPRDGDVIRNGLIYVIDIAAWITEAGRFTRLP